MSEVQAWGFALRATPHRSLSDTPDKSWEAGMLKIINRNKKFLRVFFVKHPGIHAFQPPSGAEGT
jgi:hypothetical protein